MSTSRKSSRMFCWSPGKPVPFRFLSGSLSLCAAGRIRPSLWTGSSSAAVNPTIGAANRRLSLNLCGSMMHHCLMFRRLG